MMSRLWLPLAVAIANPVIAEEEIRFNRDVRPILSDNCYYCHGPDKETQEADLRLDTFEGATADLGGYAAVVPGNPEESELILRIHDTEDLMPPDSSKKILSTEQKNILSRWIKQGAKYEPHWSFLPLEEAQLPVVRQEAWPKNEIDKFVLARLEQDNINPSPEADRDILIRRLYLDLVGLLPTAEQVTTFLNDKRPDAYEHLVDDLLASPHYGERWGRHWLDQARYADSNGYSIDSPRQMWPYRDWVIHALNEDMPFDQFTIEQLAGDLLPTPTKSQRIATAFHRNTLINQEGGVDPEQFRVEAAIDRTNTTGAVWLGLTLGCAQCHTHKFDPIQHREYFEMYAFFNSGTDRNSRGKTIPVRKGEVFGHPISDPPSTISRQEQEILQTDWEKKTLAALRSQKQKLESRSWTPGIPKKSRTTSGAALKVLEDHSLLIQDGLGPNDTFLITTNSIEEGASAVRLRVIPHESLPQRGPGQAQNGNFVITGFEVWSNGEFQPIAHAKADHQQSGYPANALIDGKSQTGWAINRSRSNPDAIMNAPHEVVFTLKNPLPAGPVEVKILHKRNAHYHVGRFALDFAFGATQSLGEADLKLLAALEARKNKRRDSHKKLIEERFTSEFPKAKLPEADLGQNLAELMIMEDRSKPRKTFILTRGDFTRPDREVGPLNPGGLSSVSPALPAKEGRNRLDLAKWLIHPENPLTPRVTINRIWMHYFGRGLVETEEDFGTQGSLPSHPELLDWLGLRFIKNKWSMKSMHRLITTSATYRQSSHTRPDLADIDPRNILLTRQARLRVEAEIVRDAALCSSGLFNPEVGGPSVYPEQPSGVYAFTQTGKPWNTSTDSNRYRRAMYTAFYRSAPYPLFTTFDAPDFSSVCTRRVRSNTPLQALNLANDPVFLELARALALRLAKEAPDNLEAKINYGFQLCFSRPPSEKEEALLSKHLRTQSKAWQSDPRAAKHFAGPELTKQYPKAGATLLSLARTLLNTDNFITRE